MNTLRNLFVTIAVVLGTLVVAADHFLVNSYVGEFVRARTHNTEEVAKILAAQESARFADNLASVVRLQGVRVSELELKIHDLGKVLAEKDEEIKRRDTVIAEYGKQIQAMASDNTLLLKAKDDASTKLKVAKELADKLSTELAAAKAANFKLAKEVTAAKLIIDDLTKQLKAAKAEAASLGPDTVAPNN